MLGDCIGGVVGDAGDGDAQCFGSLQIDVVKARAAQCDIFDPVLLELLQAEAVERVVDEDADRFAIMRQNRRFDTEPVVEIGEAMRRTSGLIRCIEIGFVKRLRAENGGVHDRLLSKRWRPVQPTMPVFERFQRRLTARAKHAYPRRARLP